MKKDWIQEYIDGTGHEIYRTTLSTAYSGFTFSNIAARIYKDFQGIMFAIEIDIDG